MADGWRGIWVYGSETFLAENISTWDSVKRMQNTCKLAAGTVIWWTDMVDTSYDIAAYQLNAIGKSYYYFAIG